jgi:hypothetical protein
MRISSADREGIRVMHHLFGYGVAELARMFGVLPTSMTRIIRDRYVAPTGDNRVPGKERDRREVLTYIAQNGPCSAFDVELCLMLDRKAVRRHLMALEGQHEIERCYFGCEKWRAAC